MNSKAFDTIEKRIESSTIYKEIRTAALTDAAAICSAWRNVEDAKAAGGRSTVVSASIERAIEASPHAHKEMGSKLIPATPASVLRSQVVSLQKEAQRMEFDIRRAC